MELPEQYGGSVSVCDWLAVQFLPIKELSYKTQKRPAGIEETDKTTQKLATNRPLDWQKLSVNSPILSQVPSEPQSAKNPKGLNTPILVLSLLLLLT